MTDDDLPRPTPVNERIRRIGIELPAGITACRRLPALFAQPRRETVQCGVRFRVQKRRLRPGFVRDAAEGSAVRLLILPCRSSATPFVAIASRSHAAALQSQRHS